MSRSLKTYGTKIPLPSLNTLRKYAAKMDMSEGILYEVLKLMKKSRILERF